MKQYHLLPGANREQPFLDVMLAGFPGLARYITVSEAGDMLLIQHEEQAGGGATFILEALDALLWQKPVMLGDMARLDPINVRVFLRALEAWYEGEAP